MQVLKKGFKVHPIWVNLTFWLVLIGFVIQLVELHHTPSPLEPEVFMVLTSVLTLIFCHRVQRAFLPLFLR